MATSLTLRWSFNYGRCFFGPLAEFCTLVVLCHLVVNLYIMETALILKGSFYSGRWCFSSGRIMSSGGLVSVSIQWLDLYPVEAILCPFDNTGFPKQPKYEKNCPSQTQYFLKRLYPRLSKNGKMKMFHFYPKEWIHKTSFSEGILTRKSNISMINQNNL